MKNEECGKGWEVEEEGGRAVEEEEEGRVVG